jgi:hypothetical protein
VKRPLKRPLETHKGAIVGTREPGTRRIDLVRGIGWQEGTGIPGQARDEREVGLPHAQEVVDFFVVVVDRNRRVSANLVLYPRVIAETERGV